MRQKTLRVFEVEDFDNLEKVIKSKYLLIKNHVFMLKEKNEKIEKLLRDNNLNYFVLNNEGSISEKKEDIKVVYKEKIIHKDTKTQIYDRIIRGGEEIEKEGSCIFLNRINPGAKIVVRGSVEIFAENRGVVIVEGDYLIVKENRGRVVFNGEEIGKIDKLTIFTKEYKKVLE